MRIRVGLLLFAALAACAAPPARPRPLPNVSGVPVEAAPPPVVPVEAPAADTTTAPPDSPPPEVNEMGAFGARIDAAVAGAVGRGEVPGAVIVVVRDARVVFRKAYGLRRRTPAPVPMTTDTVFDLASVTKPLATATSVLHLVEQQKLALADPVAKHLPELAGSDLGAATIEQLLLHTAGLPPATPLSEWKGGLDAVIRRLARMRPLHAPGERHVYSDTGYVLLGEVVARKAAEPLDAFLARWLTGPLGLRDTTFRPGPELARRAAPTESRGRSLGEAGAAGANDEPLAGEVHDPRARLLGGVAGHAGLFSTADDVAVLLSVLLRGGERGGVRVMRVETARELLQLRRIPGAVRSLAFGGLARGLSQTGFSGTYVWLDPGTRTALVLLTNRLHAEGGGEATAVRRGVLDAVLAWIDDRERVASTERGGVWTGIDVLAANAFRAIAGKRVGLLTNASGRDRRGARTIDVLRGAPGVRLVALFAPEHGLGADREGEIADGRDAATGLPIRSLYGSSRRSSPDRLRDVDAIVVDLQDAGTRFFTYAATLASLLEAAAAAGKRVVVLDRPNPLGGAVEGPLVDRGRESFVAFHSVPIRHGMTFGEIARLVAAERGLRVDLEVVPMQGWHRRMRFDETGLVWTSPSPNLTSAAAALTYPATGLLETTNVSVGRGTDRPLSRVGAPWIDGGALARALEAASLPGVRFSASRFTPSRAPFAGVEVSGVDLDVTDADAFEPVRTGLEIARQLRRLHGATFQLRKMDVLLANRRVLEALERGDPTDAIVESWRDDVARFLERRAPALLY